MTLITLSKIYKRYEQNDDFVLCDVSFNVEKGVVLGLIGPNGSGKTTLLALLTNIVKATEGQLIIERDLKMGAFIESPNFYNHLTAEQNLFIVADIKGVTDHNYQEILDLVGLPSNSKKTFGQYSLGMKQRLGIAAKLIGNPDLIILDEPTNGLDPIGLKDIRDVIIKLSQSGKTIIITSHILSEIEKLCTHLVILFRGRIKYFGPKSEISERAKINSQTMEEIFLSYLQ